MQIRIKLEDADLQALDEIARLENQARTFHVTGLEILRIGLAARLAELAASQVKRTIEVEI